tara:strand:+ start:221 stop:415 length:195 start_codon:yes stop_codon:yes gene_type:complete
MIDEDRTFENEVRFHNDRLGIKNNRENYKINISLDLESSNSTKMEKKKKINEIYSTIPIMLANR